jgi:hypothetical protein
MAFISREDALKLVALLVVALFIFETFAYQGPRTTAQQPANTGQSTPGAAVAGAAIVDATVLSYGSELAIANIDAKAQAVIDQLKARNIVQYASRRPDGAFVLNLDRKANMSEIAGLFEGSNATIAARARLKMPTIINFTTSTGAVSAVFQDISLEFSPQVPVGGNISVRINANIRDGAVESYSAYPVAIRVKFNASARIASYEPSHYALFAVRWEDRNFDGAGLKAAFAARYPNGTFTLLRNDSVLIDVTGLNFSEAYVAGTYIGRIEVLDNFTDRQRLQDDLFAAGSQAPAQFPDSQVVLEFQGENANLSFVGGFAKYYVTKDYRKAVIELPAEVKADNNRTYELAERNLTVEIAAGPIGSDVNLTFSGAVFGGKLNSIRAEDSAQ